MPGKYIAPKPAENGKTAIFGATKLNSGFALLLWGAMRRPGRRVDRWTAQMQPVGVKWLGWLHADQLAHSLTRNRAKPDISHP